MVGAIFDNLKAPQPRNHFTVGINDDVTGTSLPINEFINSAPEEPSAANFTGWAPTARWAPTKNSIKIIGDHTDMYVQGYFAYDSKKSGGITISHLGLYKPIRSTYLIDSPDFVACHNPSYVTRYEILEGIKDGGIFLLNSPWSAQEMEERLPASLKNTIARKRLRFYNCDAVKVAREAGLGGRINMVMMAAFFKLSGVIPYEDAEKYMKQAVKKTYGRKATTSST